jgi:hypothetical protein
MAAVGERLQDFLITYLKPEVFTEQEGLPYLLNTLNQDDLLKTCFSLEENPSLQKLITKWIQKINELTKSKEVRVVRTRGIDNYIRIM